jgi:hypothetical protein
MDVPRFRLENLNSRLGFTDPGDAFQQFVHDVLLRSYPELHLFPTGGKDGAIDLSQTVAASRLVGECKFIGTDGIDAALSTWEAVRKKLAEHLADPAGPTKGQGQYRPWYRLDPAITEYLFCTSSDLANQDQRDRLRDRIQADLRNLGPGQAHLTHLAAVQVSVLDWSDLSRRLQEQPHLLFRWFPSVRPFGMVPLGDLPDPGGFRSYLRGETLPYYSRAEHLAANPIPSGGPPDEAELLDRLAGTHHTGLVITGVGGVGKTRLTLEIGRLAERGGWTVLQVPTKLRRNSLEQLRERLRPDTPALLLVDYVETQQDFSTLVEDVNDLNDSLGLTVRYVASCRKSYLPAVEGPGRQEVVDLNPLVAGGDWLEVYRRGAVEHILRHAGIEVTPRHREVARDLPVLAAFLAYLHRSGRTAELGELLDTLDFGAWVLKRVRLSFQQQQVSRDLARLLAVMPLPVTTVRDHPSADWREIFERLAEDGWIERMDPDERVSFERWETIHDVVADRVIVHHLHGSLPRAEGFVADLLGWATELGCLRSALTTLQRLADDPVLSRLPWPDLLQRQMREAPAAWKTVRDLVVGTPLLQIPEMLGLLQGVPEVWEGAEQDPDFQNRLGWIARRVHQGATVTEEQRFALLVWLDRCCAVRGGSNFVVTSALRLDPERYRVLALAEIRRRPVRFSTHYVLVAWLVGRLPSDEVSGEVVEWLQRYCLVPHVSFVVAEWLKAGGALASVQEPIRRWLVQHEETPEVRFVYQAWLNARGELEVVREPLRRWLLQHQETPETRFVYQAWLDAQGELEVVREPLRRWLRQHQETPETRFVYQAWLDAQGELEVVREPLRRWLLQHQETRESSFVYQAWLDAQGELEVVREPLRRWLRQHQETPEAGFVYQAWLDAQGELEVVRESLCRWLLQHQETSVAQFVYKAWLDGQGELEVVREPIRGWILQRQESPEARFVYQAWLEARGEVDLVLDAALAWLHRHREQEEAVFLTKALSDLPDLPEQAIKDILFWCRRFPTNPDAAWRLGRLAARTKAPELARELLQTAGVIVGAMSELAIDMQARAVVWLLFPFLFNSPVLQVAWCRYRVNLLLAHWIRQPHSIGMAYCIPLQARWSHYLVKLQELLWWGDLFITDDFEALSRFLVWVDSWADDRKGQLRPILKTLAREYPAPGLWERVRLPDVAPAEGPDTADQQPESA